MKVKRIAILGSTGSIGLSTLKVINRYPKKFKVVALSAYNSIDLLEKQIAKYAPKYVAVSQQGLTRFTKRGINKKIKLFDAYKDLSHIVKQNDVDVVVLGMRGAAALEPFLAAACAGKVIAPANKEALVIAGELLMRKVRKNKATVIPVDSEQSAIFQCLQGEDRKEIGKIHLTASGGALYDVPKNKFNQLSVKQILKHPRWKMGPKITVDSATLMNKGFEIIEAQRLFDLSIDQIDVVIHREAIIHSMVEFVDGSVIAQLGIPDMQLPIQYAMTYPQRLPTKLPKMDLTKLGKLHFEKPNINKFPALELAFYVARRGGTLPSVLNAADEVAVEAFLNKKIKFTKIFKIVEKIVSKHRNKLKPTLKEICDADQWAREETNKLI